MKNVIYFVPLFVLFMGLEVAKAEPNLTLPALIGAPGEQVEVDVNFTNNGQAVGAQFDIVFDESIVSVIDVESDVMPGDIITASGHTIEANSEESGRLSITITPPSDNPAALIPDGVIAKILFTISDIAAIGSMTSLTLEEVTFSDEMGNDVPADVLTNGEITVSEEVIPPSLTLPEEEGNPGEQVDIKVDFKNNGEVVGAQFDVAFDVNTVNITNVESDVVPGDIITASGHTIEANIEESGRLSIIITPPSDNPAALIPDGEVVDLLFTINPDATPGAESPITLQNVAFSSEEGGAVSAGSLNDGTIEVASTPSPSPSPSPEPDDDDDGGCSITGGAIGSGQTISNVLIPLVPAFAVGFKMARRKMNRKKKKGNHK